jgi:hypothetical protein
VPIAEVWRTSSNRCCGQRDRARLYIETHDEKYCGHFLLDRVDFTPQKLLIELDRPRDNFVSVTFAMVATEFVEASQVVKIIGLNAN